MKSLYGGSGVVNPFCHSRFSASSSFQVPPQASTFKFHPNGGPSILGDLIQVPCTSSYHYGALQGCGRTKEPAQEVPIEGEDERPKVVSEICCYAKESIQLLIMKDEDRG